MDIDIDTGAVLQEDHLKKVVGLSGAVSIAAGQVIGAGIMTLTGVAIGMTGGSVVLAYLLAALITIFAALPITYMAASLPTTGGNYRYTSRLISPAVGFLYLMVFLAGQITLAMYALSFAEYFTSIVPVVPFRLVAFLFITVFYLSNLFGVKSAANIQKLMMLVLLVSLLIFVYMGMGKIDMETFSGQNLFTGGYRGFFTATALLTFATSGAVVIAEMGGELKNPGRDIPIAIIVSTLVIGILYAFVATVAVGVLPLHKTAFQPMALVAHEIFSGPLFYFFIIGGALCALATTMNATFSWLPKGLLIACEDGWLPEKLGAVNEKYGTAHFILTLLYIIGVIPILTGISLRFIAEWGTGAILVANILPVLSSLSLAGKYPEAHRASAFRFPAPVLVLLVVIAVVLQGIQGYFLLSDIPSSSLLATLVFLVLTLLYINWRRGKINIRRNF